MPQSYQLTESILKTPVQIHEWLKDWDHVKAWMGPTLVSIEMLSEHGPDEPMCVGMRFRETRKMGKINAKAIIEVLRHDIDAQGVFRHRAVLDDGCNRMVCTYEYTPNESGTHATFLMSNEPNKWWTKALNPVMGRMMMKMCAKHLADHLEQLKSLVESGPVVSEPQPAQA